MEKVLRWTAFSLVLAFGVLGGLFAAGYAFDDPGGWEAVGMVAGYAVPSAVLCWYAATRPERAGRLLTVATVVVAALLLLNALLTPVDRDQLGPVDSVGVLALAVALGFLGLHRPQLAGRLILLAVAAQAASMFLVTAVHSADGGPPLRAALGGSSGVVIVPLLVVAVLFLLAGAGERTSAPPVDRPVG